MALVDHAASLPKRKRKKRRKRRTPRTSSRSSCGRARRRQRQWHTCGAGYPGYGPLRAVFPSVSGRLVMLGIMAGMDQKGFFKFVDIPFVPQRQILMVQTIQQTTEFPQLLYVSGGRCPCCAGRACHAALVSTTAVCAQGWLCWFRYALAVFLLVVAGQDLRHLGRYGPEGHLLWYVQGWYCW